MAGFQVHRYCPSSINKGEKANAVHTQGTWKQPPIPKIGAAWRVAAGARPGPPPSRRSALPGSAASSGSGGAFL